MKPAAPAELLPWVALPDDLPAPAADAAPQPPTEILLTGATGFLGAYLLAELLARPGTRVHCLVRAPDAAAGLARLRASLAQHGLAADFGRVVAVPGAVDRPQLGLDDDAWRALAGRIDAIVHAAANVSFLPAFEKLVPVNVAGTLALIRLAGAVRNKPLHLVSTYAVFNAAEYRGLAVATETPLAGAGTGFRRGYPASKWVSERLGDLARERGWSVTAYRAGLLWGDARTGRGKPDDIFALNVAACRTLGLFQDIDFLMHLTPVDFAARAVAAVVAAPAYHNGHYHCVTEAARPWREFAATMNRLGHRVEPVPPAAWFEAFKRALPAHPEWAPLFWLLSQDPRRSFWNDANIFSLQFDAARLRRALAGTGVACPVLDDAGLKVYLDCFAATRT